MCFFYTDSPEADAENYYAAQQDKFEKRPVCDECNQHIRDEECYVFDDKIICPECLKDNHFRWTENCI